MAAKSENLNSSSKLRLYEHNKMLKFLEIKTNVPKSTQEELCYQLGFSDSSIKRYRDDINMDSPYNKKNFKWENTLSNTTITATQTHTPRDKTEKIRILERTT